MRQIRMRKTWTLAEYGYATVAWAIDGRSGRSSSTGMEMENIIPRSDGWQKEQAASTSQQTATAQLQNGTVAHYLWEMDQWNSQSGRTASPTRPQRSRQRPRFTRSMSPKTRLRLTLESSH